MQILGVANFTATIPNAFMQSYRRPQATAAWAAPNLKQITHSMPPEKIELFKSLKPWASENLVPLLSPVDTCWQPNQLLPDPAGPVADFMNDVRALRDRTKGLSDEYIVVLVGNMIAEQANPTYMAVLNTTDGTRDETGNSPCPWAVWTRAWTAEENRHGDVLKSYLYLSGRVDMVAIERTVQYLIRAGMNPGLENSPFLGYVYSSFQERATFVTYCNTSRLAKEGGDPVLANICDVIAADEKRHEGAYIKIVEKLLEVDPNETILAIAKLLRNKITMPAHLMYDGHDPQLFQHFSFVSHKLGVYTSTDYTDIIDYLVGRWSLEKLQGLKAEGRREQEYVCNLAPTIRKLQAQAEDSVCFPRVKFSWIFNRQV